MENPSQVIEHCRRAHDHLSAAVIHSLKQKTGAEDRSKRGQIKLCILNAYLSMSMVDDYITADPDFERVYAMVREALGQLRHNKNKDGTLMHPRVLTSNISACKDLLYQFRHTVWKATEVVPEQTAQVYVFPDLRR